MWWWIAKYGKLEYNFASKQVTNIIVKIEHLFFDRKRCCQEESHVRLFSSNWRFIAAGSILATIPIVIFFLAMQKYFISGENEGAVKG